MQLRRLPLQQILVYCNYERSAGETGVKERNL